MLEGLEIVSPQGVVGTAPKEAARVGAGILEQGGNAMDAAVAASIVCSMLWPHRTGIGGYLCCAVVLEGKSDRVWSVDANSLAPAAAHERMFEITSTIDRLAQQDESENVSELDRLNEDEYACSVRDNANVHGPLAVGPPGMLAGIGTIWERWGRLKWPQWRRSGSRLTSTCVVVTGASHFPKVSSISRKTSRIEPAPSGRGLSYRTLASCG